MKVILYTALLGHYDELYELPATTINSYCITNQENINNSTWQIKKTRQLFQSIDEQVRQCRFYKTQPQMIFPDADIWIWSDACFEWIADPKDVLGFLDDTEIATFKYPDIYGFRDCIYEEGVACILRNKDSKDVIEKQMKKYRKNGYKEHCGLVETTLLVRKNTSTVRAFNQAWWREIENGSRRDQLSFNYSIWKEKLNYSIIPGYRLKNDWGHWHAHKENIYK